MKIYTITMVEKIHTNEISPDQYLPEFGDRRCIGYYTNFSDAVAAITICDLHRKYYEYCIIEEIHEGVYKDTPNRWLYKREQYCKDDYIYVPIAEPEEIKNVRNFGIG